MTGAQSDDGSPGDAPVADRLDGAFDLLAHPYRRHALLVLRDRDREVAFDDLAHTVMVRVHGTVLGAEADALYDRVRIRLHHTHLPKLRAANVVRYDPDRRAVSLASDAGRVEQLLDDLSFVTR